MGLLDSDAEELKRNKGNEPSSGRKVNQSGLGALRGLSKYSNLTAKYRTTGKDEAAEKSEIPASVEHSRGTIESKSVQSPCEVSAKPDQPAPILENTEVSANPVLSQCNISDAQAFGENTEVGAKSVQSGCNEVPSLDLIETIALENAEIVDTFKVSAKSVQIPVSDESLKVEKTIAIDILSEENKSVQEVSALDLNRSQVKNNDTIVSAKSVQVENSNSSLSNLDSLSDRLIVDDELNRQSQCKVSAERVVEGAELKHETKKTPTIEVSAKSVQSQGKVSASKSVQKQVMASVEVGAKSVQIRGESVVHSMAVDEVKVSAKSVQSQGNVSADRLVQKTPPAALKVGAKSVQSPGEVSADNFVEHDPQSGSRSKVITHNEEMAEPTESIISIAGSQRVIVDFMFQLCLWNNSLITPPITKQQLTAETGLLEETALSSIKRLRKKNIIDRYDYKDGKAGWTRYQFSDTSYRELVHLRQVGAKSVQGMNLDGSRPFAPSLHPLEKKHAADVRRPGVEQSWFKDLDFSKVHPINAMAVNAAIRTQVQEKLNSELVQDFINRFTSWTSTQGKITSPIGLFCDKLKELVREGDSPVFSCMTEEERQMELGYAAQVEKARLEMELINKARSENNEKAEETAFNDWYNSSSESEKREYAEPSSLAPMGSEAYRRLLKASYLERRP